MWLVYMNLYNKVTLGNTEEACNLRTAYRFFCLKLYDTNWRGPEYVRLCIYGKSDHTRYERYSNVDLIPQLSGLFQ